MDHFTPKRDSLDSSIFKTINNFTSSKNSRVVNNAARLPSIEDFSIIKPISRGAFGKVFLAYKKDKDDQKLFAVKVMKKSEMINKNMVSQVITERNALALSRSPFCVNLFYSLQTSSSIYLVMEYMVGGDLKSLLAMYGFFDESSARFYCAEISMALSYLHEHGIVHRDIKPDNMLIAASGHVKLTDFGLSKIELGRDLEISDLVNDSPNLNENFHVFNTRTPGQLLSLTTHLSFGSSEKQQSIKSTNDEVLVRQPSNLMIAMNKHNSSSEAEGLDISQDNTSKISGISPFFSTENLEILSPNATEAQSIAGRDSASSYYTCNSSLSDSMTKEAPGLAASFHGFQFGKPRNHVKFDPQIDVIKNKSPIGWFPKNKTLSIPQNDSGISSKKSDSSKSEESSNNEKTKEEISSCSDLTRSFNNENTSPLRNFKRPGFLRGIRRRRQFELHTDSPLSEIGYNQSSTGLTQEIDTLDIGSSTPKKRRAKSPLKGVLKMNSLSDDDTPLPDNLGNVCSTPVSSQKVPRRDNDYLSKYLNKKIAKMKTARFDLPSSDNKIVPPKEVISDGDCITSPVANGNRCGTEKTPKAVQTPYRTPKSVRRGLVSASNERILGTPDYLAPELLLLKGHGPEVDWWALGVCMYEFVTGIPPFNDETPQKVFDNVLQRNIEWPQDDEALSNEAVEAIELLLTVEPKDRPDAKVVQKMDFFKDVDWNDWKSLIPPFVPSPDDPTDTGYFTAKNVMQHLKLSNFE